MKSRKQESKVSFDGALIVLHNWKLKVRKTGNFQVLDFCNRATLKEHYFPLEKYTHRAGRVTRWAEQAGEPESPEPSQRQGMVACPCHPRAKSKSPGTHRPASLAFAVWQTTKHFFSQKEKGGSQYPRLFSKRHSMYISTLAHMNYTQATLVYSDIHTTHKHMHTQISS